MIDSLPALQRWYESRCDGVWEHAHGIEIASLDNAECSVVAAE
ncbi:Imm53 family immunity protein [Burkholderia lata]|nr:Imm53 family immunity protein [Burkholderia lata]